MRPKLLSLCSGFCGLDHAVEEVFDAEVVAVSDIDPGANKILAHRYPNIPNLGDLKLIDWDAWAGTDIMTAGYPCQPFSHAGKRAGTDDPRHIFPWIVEGIRRVGPRLVLLENVRGHLRLGFDVVLGALADIGYDARWVCLRASDVGACHKRERLFIAATPANAIGGGWDWRSHDPVGQPVERAAAAWRRPVAAPVELLPTPTSRDNKGRNQRGSSGDLMLPSAVLRLGTTCPTCGCDDGLHDSDGFCAGPCGGNAFDCGGRDLHLLPTPAVNDMGRGKTVEAWDEWTARMKAAHGNGNGHGPSLEIEAMRLLPTPTRQDALGSRNSTAWRSDPDKPVNIGDTLTDFAWKYAGLSDPRMPANEPMTGWGKYATAIARQETAFGYPAPPPTEPTGKDGAHRLSPRFVEWMMNCEPGWVTEVPGLSRNDMLKALGNGVVKSQAAAAIRFITAPVEVAS